ncbi:chromosome partitioning protein ParA [Mergibacter septicus]|uniref:Chromosome partitioning protein ParA n=1 Tax=Mergibacter septicus TaxID=221402 RepID=A0A8D4IWI7_9PAST|nr:ParA family protein [Mergibacter septicus]AWX14694.1 chromosome partitioning protein ParA [Mergibacter septicus]QDJ13945.1 chromosome partitioning protein ParA [Mergibacter septicus]UTU48605.1 ParA family protein [Mergibacter septicus]WMR95766.1 ParA family protein [Mergibacter septicus]
MKTVKKPFITTILSTKGGVTKTTNAANISAFCADHKIKTLMIDTDVQPSLSSYYELDYSAPGGIYEFIINQNLNTDEIISKTTIQNLDLIKSNDPTGKISLLLRNSPDGVIRFNHLLQQINDYDLIIIDTKGSRDITLEMSVLASHLILSPLLPELLSTREFLRGTLSLYNDLRTYTNFGFQLPPIKAVANRVDNTNDAKDVITQLHQIFKDENFNNTDNYSVEFLELNIPARVAYREANTLCMPIHRYRESEFYTMKLLCSQLFPQFSKLFEPQSV